MRGFTLIETLIYIALLGVLMTGTILVSYELLENSALTSSKAVVQDEGGFVLRKIDVALSGAQDVTGVGTTLTVTRYDGNTISFRLNGTAVEMKESAGAGVYLPITTASNVSVQSLVFQVVGTSMKKVSATVTLKTAHGTDSVLPFTLIRYLRI